MHSLLQRYTPPIVDYQIQHYDHETPLFRLKMVINLIDGSQLFVRVHPSTETSLEEVLTTIANQLA